MMHKQKLDDPGMSSSEKKTLQLSARYFLSATTTMTLAPDTTE